MDQLLIYAYTQYLLLSVCLFTVVTTQYHINYAYPQSSSSTVNANDAIISNDKFFNTSVVIRIPELPLR